MDRSNGYEAVAQRFIANRDLSIGKSIIKSWAGSFAPGTEILDLGCGFGEPGARILRDAGHRVFGVDASPTLVGEFRKRQPMASVACEVVEDSKFFNKTFDGIIAVGLMFVLPMKSQLQTIAKVSTALNFKGRFLFSCPYQNYSWNDNLTGNTSLSLGRKFYKSEFTKYGLSLINEYTDEGDNHYFEFQKNLEFEVIEYTNEEEPL